MNLGDLSQIASQYAGQIDELTQEGVKKLQDQVANAREVTESLVEPDDDELGEIIEAKSDSLKSRLNKTEKGEQAEAPKKVDKKDEEEAAKQVAGQIQDQVSEASKQVMQLVGNAVIDVLASGGSPRDVNETIIGHCKGHPDDAANIMDKLVSAAGKQVEELTKSVKEGKENPDELNKSKESFDTLRTAQRQFTKDLGEIAPEASRPQHTRQVDKQASQASPELGTKQGQKKLFDDAVGCKEFNNFRQMMTDKFPGSPERTSAINTLLHMAGSSLKNNKEAGGAMHDVLNLVLNCRANLGTENQMSTGHVQILKMAKKEKLFDKQAETAKPEPKAKTDAGAKPKIEAKSDIKHELGAEPRSAAAA